MTSHQERSTTASSGRRAASVASARPSTEARSAGRDEALLLDAEGRVCEGSRSNVFATIDGRLVTPPASLGILPGVYRRYLPKKHPAIIERHLTPADLLTADAIYVTNAVWEVRLAISE